MASEAGNLTARYDYARLLASDKAGAKKDVDKAHELLLDLANRGNESAQLGLAIFYRYKKRDAAGGANLVEAYAWANVVLAGRGARSPTESVPFFRENSYISYTFIDITILRDRLEDDIPKESLALAQSRSSEIFKAITEARQKK
jgi:TPR repeat protein